MKNILTLATDLAEIKRNSPYKNPYSINIFEYYHSTEPHTSWALGSILQYTPPDNAYGIIQSFFGMLKLPIADKIKHPVVTIEKERIDVMIKDEKYVVIIENKLKGADYQRNQLGRYVQKMIDNGYRLKDIYIVILPQSVPKDQYLDKLRESVWKCPYDYNSPNNNRKCSVDDYQCWCDTTGLRTEEEQSHCQLCIDYSGKVTTCVLHKELSEWLKDIANNKTLIPSTEYPLRSMIWQFADYLDYLYNNRDNDNLRKEMIDFLKEKLFTDKSATLEDNTKKIDNIITNVNELATNLEDLKTQLYKELLDSWYSNLKQQYPNLQFDDYKQGEYFSVPIIQGIRCYFYIEEGEKPYWEFRTETQTTPTQLQLNMVEAIISDKEAAKLSNAINSGWMYWQYTYHGDNDFRQFYENAKRLGYL